jgi:hypothetical protein
MARPGRAMFVFAAATTAVQGVASRRRDFGRMGIRVDGNSGVSDFPPIRFPETMAIRFPFSLSFS